MSETEYSDHDERVLAVIDRRPPPPKTQRRSYAATVKGEAPNNHNNHGDTYKRNNRHERYGGNNNARIERNDHRTNPSNAPSDAPIHERLALSRRNSRRNIERDGNQTRGESWGDSDDPRDQEIRELKTKIRNMETKPEQTVKQIDNPNNAQKNAQPAQRETGKDINEMKQMKNFLVDVMAAINAFDQKLLTQLDTNQILTDRS